MIRLAVTGAGGYLGGALVAAADADPGLSVRAVLRESAPWLPGETVHITDLEHDAVAAFEGIDVVVHLAGPNEVETARDPVGTLASAVSAARAVSDACVTAGVRRLVDLSTVHVYGAALSPGAVVDELTIPMPRHPYAIARLACEHMMAAGAGDTELVVLRLTNSVGAPADAAIDRWSLVANDLCRQAATGDTIALKSDGQDWRDFVALDDVCRIILGAADSDRVPPGTYNLGSGRSMTVRELAGLVIEAAAAQGLGALELRAPEGRTEPPEPYTVRVDRLGDLGLSASVPVSSAVADTLAFCVAHPS
jgi:UDP-glucose 4-epimerase